MYILEHQSGKEEGYFTQSNTVGPVQGWIHLVLNYAPRMFEVYVNAQQTLADITKFGQKTTFGDGRIVLGRAYSEVNNYYTSMVVDEVEFFNEWINPRENRDLYQSQRA